MQALQSLSQLLNSQHFFVKTAIDRDFTGGPVVKTSPSNAGGTGLIPGWGAKISHASLAKNQNIKQKQGASLVAQWLTLCLLMQGTRVRALVWEDPACRGAAGPVSQNC